MDQIRDLATTWHRPLLGILLMVIAVLGGAGLDMALRVFMFIVGLFCLIAKGTSQ